MLALGMVMILFGVLLIVIGLFTAGDEGKATLLGIHVGAETVFLAGLIAAALIIVGFYFTRWGAAIGWRRRAERKEYAKMADKFDRQGDLPS